MKKSDIKILLVDDEPDILEIIGFNLENAGYQVFIAKDGVEALKQAKNISPHLIIMVVMMPILDGIEACDLIRKEDQLQQTVIMFLSAVVKIFSM